MTDEPMVERLECECPPECYMAHELSCDCRLTTHAHINSPALRSRLREQEERAERAEATSKRLTDRYHHLMPNHGTTPLLRDICQCGRDKLAASEQALREAQGALERVRHYALRHVGTDSRAILSIVDAALAPDTEEGTE